MSDQMTLLVNPAVEAVMVRDAAGQRLTKRDKILLVLSDGRWHNGDEFLGGHNSMNVWCSSYSQRVGDLIAEGVRIERKLGKNGLAEYRLL